MEGSNFLTTTKNVSSALSSTDSSRGRESSFLEKLFPHSDISGRKDAPPSLYDGLLGVDPLDVFSKEPTKNLLNSSLHRAHPDEFANGSSLQTMTTKNTSLGGGYPDPAYPYNDTEFWPQVFCDWNGTVSCWNSSFYNGTSADQEVFKYWKLLLFIFPIFTVFGNILVVLSVVRERSLRTVTNYFICSLAVADILVAVVVMPPAVYYEVLEKWALSDQLCDAWVASDVMACTASILNLTAISVDRFIAVTQPIKYAKHKNSKRVFIMLALTWLISVAIAAPIALGVNYSDKRQPFNCAFFNSDFLIYSSMGSFYIPSVMMIFLYWRIYRVLRERTLKSQRQKKARTVDKLTLQNVIENRATTSRGDMALANDNSKGSPARGGGGGGGSGGAANNVEPLKEKRPQADTCSVTNAGTGSDTHDEDEDYDDGQEDSGPKSPTSEEAQDNVIENNKSTMELMMNTVNDETTQLRVDGKVEYTAPSNVEIETQFNATRNPRKNLLSPPRQKFAGLNKKGSGKKKGSPRKSVTKFNFHMRTASKKKKDRGASKREKKATKTLAIVLGVFLFCWWPFFTINIINAICLRYNLEQTPACNLDPILFSFFTWLGYINSFLNPVIYTIFNPEFRKAFRRILTESCK